MARRARFTLNLGQLVGTTFKMFFRNIIPSTLLSAVVMSPWAALQLYLIEAERTHGLEWLSTPLFNALTFILTGALTFGVVQQLRGRPASVSQQITQGVQAFLRVLSTSLLCALRILLFTCLLWIPGVIESTRLYVAVPTAVMEGKGASESIERSIRLTNGSRWQIFGSWLIMFLLSVLPAIVLGFILATSMDYREPAPDLMVFMWWIIGLSILAAQLSATAMPVCYFLLRTGKEQIDAKEIAAVFD